MFKKRGQDSPIYLGNFGVGSTLTDKDIYLVIKIGHKHATLLNMMTFEKVNSFVQVDDINHFTEEEVRQLHNSINDDTSFSEYICNAEGYKTVSQ